VLASNIISPEASMENHVYSSTASEPMNHTPDVAVGVAVTVTGVPATVVVRVRVSGLV